MQQAVFTTYQNAEELESARIKKAAQTSHTERFYTLMKLIKVSALINSAKIVSSPQIPHTK